MDIRIIQDTDFELLKRKYIGTGRKRANLFQVNIMHIKI